MGTAADLASPPGLGSMTDEEREIVRRAESRRLALMGDQQQLRARFEEVMRWVNPPWDPVSRRVDPRPEAATASRDGVNIFHVDQVGQVVTRWAALQAAAAPIFRCKPPPTPPPVPHGDADQHNQPVQPHHSNGSRFDQWPSLHEHLHHGDENLG